MSSVPPAIVADLAPTGTLRVAINLGNPVLAQGTPDAPSGVTVDIARELGQRLDVPVTLTCFDAARKSFEALADGRADLCFLAIDPKREEQVVFTAPYVVIEGVFVVPTDSRLHSVADVDHDGVRIGVKEGSAYDLFLTRTLKHATVVRGAEGVGVLSEQSLEAGAGIRQPVTQLAEAHDDVRLIDEAFMQIQQAVGMPRDRLPESLALVRSVVEDLKASGFVADALLRSGQGDATVATAG